MGVLVILGEADGGEEESRKAVRRRWWSGEERAPRGEGLWRGSSRRKDR